MGICGYPRTVYVTGQDGIFEWGFFEGGAIKLRSVKYFINYEEDRTVFRLCFLFALGLFIHGIVIHGLRTIPHF